MECGSDPREVEEAQAGEHTYSEYRIFGDLSLVLCDFCQVDFSSYDPAFFGLPPGRPVGMASGWRFLRDVDPGIKRDKCCSRCGYRLPFLEFVVRARALHTVA